MEYNLFGYFLMILSNRVETNARPMSLVTVIVHTDRIERPDTSQTADLQSSWLLIENLQDSIWE